jgi:DNA polymerase
MNELHLDFETYSEEDLASFGAYKYACHASTEILMMAVAVNNEKPLIFIPEFYSQDCADNVEVIELLTRLLPLEDTIIFAHNAQFEIAITRYLWTSTFPGVPVPRLNQWRCTAAMARRAALHASLAGIGEDLGLTNQKDKLGSDLIKKFSIPQKETKYQQARRIYPWEEPEEFAAFAAYCIQDVVVERDVHKALKFFLPNGSCLQHFQLDLAINDRGVPVNVPALKNALVILEETTVKLATKFFELTGLNHTQRAKIQSYLQLHGFPFNDMQAATVENALTEITWADDPIALEVLTLYSDLSYAAVGKIKSMLGCEGGDGFVRGTLQYYGANTGRWSGRLIQPQNFKRATIKGTAQAYQMIQEGCSASELEMVFGNPIEVLSSCIRHFIQPHQGTFFQADYAAIEARIVCWLAGQENALQEYRQGIDRYKLMASIIYGIPVVQVNDRQRWVGKQAVLGCGFQLWYPGFQAQCLKYGVDIDIETSQQAVVTFRDYHHKVVSLWRSCQQQAKQAINSPGKWFRAGDHIAFACSLIKPAGKSFLFLRLPSGRMLAYPEPRLEMVKRLHGGKNKAVEQITFYGPVPNRNAWGRTSTYGGKLCENATQAVAADLMANGAVHAELKGFVLATLIHDEALAYAHPDLSVQDFCDALCTLPSWADGLPLVAEGKEIPYYLK